MTVIKIYRDMENKYQEAIEGTDIPTGEVPARGDILAMGTLPRGMTSGEPSIGMVVRLPDGSGVYAETSLKMFQMAAAAFEGEWGDTTAGNVTVFWDPPRSSDG